MNYFLKLIYLFALKGLLLFSYTVQANNITLSPSLALLKADANQHTLTFTLTN